MSVSSGSAGVRRVTSSHTAVVISVVARVCLAKTAGSEPLNGKMARNETDTISAVVIAAISLQALIRHQYQRSRYTLPVPAPTSNKICQPARIETSSQETHAPTITSSAVVQREIET